MRTGAKPAQHSQGRLEALIAERTKKGADRKAIDARIWGLFGERWAVMFTDLSGFSPAVAHEAGPVARSGKRPATLARRTPHLQHGFA